ncbi:MAG: hypothetical protein IPM82_26805 [Saprospiraceae bacterium]|nr:hypothetical protein [Saprospiraceae bacterium]
MDINGISDRLNEDETNIRDKETGTTPSAAAAKREKAAQLSTGFIAQEVEAAAKELGYDFSGVDRPQNEDGLYGLRYAEFVVPLVKAVQEQQEEIGNLKSEVQAGKLEIANLQSQLSEMNDLKARMAKLEAALLQSPTVSPSTTDK